MFNLLNKTRLFKFGAFAASDAATNVFVPDVDDFGFYAILL